MADLPAEKINLQQLRIDKTKKSRPPGRAGRWAWRLIPLAVLVFLLYWFFFRGGAAGIIPAGAKTVRTATVTRLEPSGGGPLLTAGGYIIARYQIEVASKITGRVMRLEVDEGNTVEKGQVLARLDDDEYRAQLGQSKAALEAAKAQLAELEAGSRPQEIERARAVLAGAEAEIKTAGLDAGRAESLVAGGILEQQALDNARNRLDQARAAGRQARENLDLAIAGPRREEIDRARAAVRQAAATLELVQAQLDHTIIRAPIWGVILTRYVDLGEMVTTGFTSERGARQALFSMADVQDLQVELDIAEADIAKVQHQLPVVVVPDAYPGRQYQGLVEFIAATGDRQKATIKVKVKVQNSDEYLRPEMGAKATFYPAGAPAIPAPVRLLIPRGALATRDGRSCVFLIREGRAEIRQVRSGPVEGERVEILEGLSGPEVLILNPQGIEDGLAVQADNR